MGANKGVCSGQNWFARPSRECELSCVHVSLLNPPPYYAIWRYGPRALPWDKGATLPRYSAHGSAAVREMAKHFENPKEILMSTYCESQQIAFAGVSFFSPNYRVKAERLLKKAVEIRPQGIDTLYFYADFLREQGRDAAALEYARRADAAPGRPGREASDAGLRAGIRRLLAELGQGKK